MALILLKNIIEIGNIYSYTALNLSSELSVVIALFH